MLEYTKETNINKQPTDKNSIRKKTNNVKDKIVSTLCIVSILFSSAVVTRNSIMSNKKYLKDNAQVVYDANLFDANLDVMKLFSNQFGSTETVRLKHNNNEPIYVTLSKDITKPEIIDTIKKGLNYIENVFSDINNKYRFEIIDKKTALAKKAIGKAVINIKTKEEFKSFTKLGDNTVLTNKSLLDVLSNNNKTNIYTVSSFINLKSDLLNESSLKSNRTLFVLIHELLHCFGLGDVYYPHDDKLTFMNVGYGFFSEMLSPNDLRCLYATYCEKHIKSDGSIDVNKVNEIKTKLDKYENEYFNTISKKIITDSKITPTPITNLNGTFEITLAGNKHTFNVNKQTVELTITDKNNKELKTYTGTIQYGENFAVLKNFNTEDNTKDLNLFFTLYKNQEGELTVVRLINRSHTKTTLQKNLSNIVELEK